MIVRNELEDQMLKNLAAGSLGNLRYASSIRWLNQLLKDDYRGTFKTFGCEDDQGYLHKYFIGRAPQ